MAFFFELQYKSVHYNCCHIRLYLYMYLSVFKSVIDCFCIRYYRYKMQFKVLLFELFYNKS